MNGELFDLYVKTQLAPTLQSGDVIILDNLSFHKSPTATAALKAVGAGFRFRAKPSTGRLCCPSNLPPYSPDLNPVEMAFAKLKALIQRAAARTYDELWHAVCHVCDLFTEEECYNFFKATESETDRTQYALIAHPYAKESPTQGASPDGQGARRQHSRRAPGREPDRA